MAEVAGQGGGEKAMALVSQARLRFGALPPQRRTRLLGGVGLLVAVIAGMVWYAGRPDWKVLFSGLEGKDVSQVSQELAAAGIPFQTSADGGGVEVPAEMMDKARMEVAAKGMPQTGRLGFELFDKPNWVGSEFDERVNYQRALEGELEHTIGTLGVVRSARVHLVLPQASLFTSEEKVAKASVVLKLKRASLAPEQVESIRNLVAGAVENLSAEQVTLVDADGRVNFGMKGRSAVAGEAEGAMEARLVAMLEPLAGAGNVRATVNMAYEEGSEERTDEVYDPAQTAALSSQKSEQTNGGSKVAQGVPGTASNTPAAAPVGAVQGSDQAASPGVPPLLQKSAKETLPVFPQNGLGPGQTTREESGTFAVTKHLVHTEVGPGRMRRVTAAVVVNDRMVMEGTGATAKSVWKPRTTEEMHRLETLAQAAVGFDEKRGDQVVMQNVSFSGNAPEVKAVGTEKFLEQAKGLLETQPALLKTALMGLVGLTLVWFVLKPVAGQLVATMREPSLLGVGGGGMASQERGAIAGSGAREELGSGTDDGGAQGEQQRRDVSLNGQSKGVLEQVTEHIRRQPVESTRLLETWISGEGEGN